MKKIKFEKAINEYLKECELNFKYNSYRSTKNRIKINILPYVKDKNIYKFTIKDYKDWKNIIEKKNYSFTYKKNLHICFVILLNYCIREYNLKENVASKCGNFKNKGIIEKGNIWSIEEFNDFLSVINDKKDYIMFKLLYFTGLRKGELLALTWKDIDFNNKTLSIDKSITRKHEIQSTKSQSSNRIIYIPDSLINDLKEIKKDNEFIFNISFTTLKRKKDNYCKLSGVKQIKIHEFRHSHACFLFENKVPIDEISSRLGHSSISITQDIYLRCLPKKETNIIKVLSSGII